MHDHTLHTTPLPETMASHKLYQVHLIPVLLATDQIYGFRGHGPTVPLGPTTALNSVELTLNLGF